MVPGLCLLPAVTGLLLKGCPWVYALLFLAAAFVLVLVVALSCCALFGWLIRLVPAPRLRAAGIIAESLPWMVYLGFQLGRNRLAHLQLPGWLPSGAGPRAWLAAGAGAM